MSDHLSTEEIYAFLDSELANAEGQYIQEHLDVCSRCRQQLSRVQQLYATIESVPEASLERDLSTAVVAELEELHETPIRLPLWLAAQGLVAAGVVAVWLTVQPSRGILAGGLLDQIDLLFWWSQWALPRVSDLRLALSTLPEQTAAWIEAVDLSGLWAPTAGLPWVPIIVGLLFMWLLSNGLLLRLGRDRG